GGHLPPKRGGREDRCAGEIDDIGPRRPRPIDPSSEVRWLARVKGPEVRWVDDGSAVPYEPIGERASHGLAEGTLVVQDKGLPLAQGAEGEVRPGCAFVQLGADHPKEAVAAARS